MFVRANLILFYCYFSSFVAILRAIGIVLLLPSRFPGRLDVFQDSGNFNRSFEFSKSLNSFPEGSPPPL